MSYIGTKPTNALLQSTDIADNAITSTKIADNQILTSKIADDQVSSAKLDGNTILPGADATQDLGSATTRWNNIYTTDLHLQNDRGNWTVIEEENYLTLRNNNTDKVYKLVMEEIE